MIGLSGLIDTLLAAKTSPRMDVLAIKNEAEIGPPGPVLQVRKVANDVRLPSNAALERMLPSAVGDAVHREGSPTRAAKADLSAAARVISAVLADVHGDAGPVRGAAPAWASTQAPNAGMLAGQLSQTIANSGLFYESHLVEFAAGNRTLAQVAQEPQARWSGPALAAALAAEAEQGAAASVNPSSAPAEAKQPLAAQVASAASAVADEVASDIGDHARPAKAISTEGAQKPPVDGGLANAQPRVDAETHPEAARVQAAYRWAEAPAVENEAPSERASTEVSTPRRSAATLASAPAASGEVIHSQSVALVHQQLDLLATSVFRWSGEAWPGVPMQWSIEQETQEREAHVAAEETMRPWITTVTMHLPRLGIVDVRLILAGDSVQARLVAADANTVARLRADGSVLARRFEAIGLRLQDFNVAGMEQA